MEIVESLFEEEMLQKEASGVSVHWATIWVSTLVQRVAKHLKKYIAHVIFLHQLFMPPLSDITSPISQRPPQTKMTYWFWKGSTHGHGHTRISDTTYPHIFVMCRQTRAIIRRRKGGAALREMRIIYSSSKLCHKSEVALAFSPNESSHRHHHRPISLTGRKYHVVHPAKLNAAVHISIIIIGKCHLVYGPPSSSILLSSGL